ncbi:MAG: hypothetical protein AAFY99_07480 [Pseudomonadota bacterium]
MAFSVFSFRKWLKRRFYVFGANSRASVSVEMAFILPTFAAMAFLTWDAGTVYTQYKRGTRHYYALGDIMSGQTTDVTCGRLDTISELVYDSYAAGNWARRPEKGSGVSFDESGALDFRFIIHMMQVEEQPDGSFDSKVNWSYYRTGQDMDNIDKKKHYGPGEYVDTPNGLRIDGLEYVWIEARLFIAPAINYLGIFDYSEKENQTHKEVELDKYFPLRFVTALNLVEDSANNDYFTEKCWDSSTYVKP